MKTIKVRIVLEAGRLR